MPAACSAAGRVVVAHQLDLHAVAAHGIDLDGRRGARHHDAARDAELAGREGDALGVIAGRGGHHTGGAFGGIQPADAVVGAPDLEREHRRQILAFDEDRSAEPGREKRRGVEAGGLRHHFRHPRLECPLQQVIHSGPISCLM
jgi:hypothetical protein